MEFNSLTSACDHRQIINQPTHITNESCPCIDLIFTISPNLISNIGVDLSLFEKYHHSLIYSVIDFKVPLPPSYLREVWDYKNANSSYIQSAVSNTDWDFLFRGADVNKKVDILNEHLKTILLIYRSRQSQSEPARATQNHPELARATQESPRPSQSQLEPTRARREPMKI